MRKEKGKGRFKPIARKLYVHLCLSCQHIFTTARRKTKCKCGGELRVIDTYKGKVRRIDRKHYVLKPCEIGDSHSPEEVRRWLERSGRKGKVP